MVSLVEGGAARACGEIQMGDILLAIDDANIERLPMTYIKPMLLGETGSKVWPCERWEEPERSVCLCALVRTRA